MFDFGLSDVSDSIRDFGTGSTPGIDAVDFSNLPAVGGGAGAAGGGGGGFWSGLGDVAKDVSGGISKVTTPLGDIAKSVLPLASLATGTMGAVAQQQGASQLADAAKQNRVATQNQVDASKQARDVAAGAQPIANTLTQSGTSALQRAEAGQLDPAMEQGIANWKRGALQQVKDFLARSGQTDSTTMLDWERFIEEQAQTMRSQALQEMKNFGVGTLGTAGDVIGREAGAISGAGQVAGGAAQSTQQQMQGIQQLIQQANAQLAKLSAGAS